MVYLYGKNLRGTDNYKSRLGVVTALKIAIFQVWVIGIGSIAVSLAIAGDPTVAAPGVANLAINTVLYWLWM